MSEQSPAIGSREFACPECAWGFTVHVGEIARTEQCPRCGLLVLIPAFDGAADVGEESGQSVEPDWDTQLDTVRVQRVMRQRRSLIRSRSHALIGLGLCIVGSGELLYFGGGAVRQHEGWIEALVYLVAALVLLWLAWRMGRLAMNLHRQSKAKLLDTPATPPDFSTLQDGKQMVENLDKLHQ